MDLGLAGRRALVTASSAGLGRGVAAALVEAGCRVACNGRDPVRLQRTVDELGDLAVAIPGDVATASGATDVVVRATEVLGGIDVLVANGGGPPPGTFESTPPSAYPAALERSLLATVAMCSVVVPEMRRQRWGRVLAVTSIAVRQPIPTLILSNTARAGLTGFLKTLALEIAADGVTVNSLQPGTHDTDRIREVAGADLAALAEQQPTRTVGDAADFGRVAAFVCSEHARYVTGAAIPVDGGSYLGLQ